MRRSEKNGAVQNLVQDHITGDGLEMSSWPERERCRDRDILTP